MRHHLKTLLLAGLLNIVHPAAGAAWGLPAEVRAFVRANPAVVEDIAARILRNETGGQSDLLATWLAGEEHASLGLGHFIWYPRGRDGPFRESFADLLAFLTGRAIALPPWLSPEADCPWPTREAFIAAADTPEMRSLRKLLAATAPLQTEFMIERLLSALPELADPVLQPERGSVRRQIGRVLREDGGKISAQGLYALLDYVNFKGEGLDRGERYRGEGWGLLQVLEAMGTVPGDGPTAFAAAAAEVLKRRVENAPVARGEGRWLAGWLRRAASYAGP